VAVSVIDLRDVRVTITFAEEEARFLAGLVLAAADRLSLPQSQLAMRIAGKFLLEGEAMKQALIEKYGMAAVLEMAERAMAAYPDVEDVAL
jgi:hypothetical protein